MVWPGEDSLFYRRSINCFPDSRIWCRGPWSGALCSMVSLSARRDCDLIRDSPNGSDQSETTPKAKDHPTQNRERNEFFNAFLIGVTFSFGWTPCVGPVLSSVLAIAASGGDGALQGALLMLVYTLGLALPFLLLALASSWVLQHFAKLKPHMGTLKKIGGALIILMGILLMLGNLNSLASLFH